VALTVLAPLLVLDHGKSPTPYRACCRWPGCAWRSRWHATGPATHTAYVAHLITSHAAGGEAA